MKFLINGEFIDKSDHYDVINLYNGEIVDTVPIGYRSDADLFVFFNALSQHSPFRLDIEVMQIMLLKRLTMQKKH